MDPSIFHLFSYLPAELRVKIWELNLPGPRLVPVRYTSVSADPSNPATRIAFRGCTSTTPIPTNLHVSREARTHALEHYQLSFNLHHCSPKVWFDFNDDVLYFPPKQGWLGSWNHFVNAVSMTTPIQLGKLRRLAVHDSLFKGVMGSNSSPNVEATCVKEFWEYVRRKFGNVEEVVVLVDGKADGTTKDGEVRVWMEGVLGCVLGKEGVWIGSSEERLVESLESGLRFLEDDSGWKAPRWEVLAFPDNGMRAEERCWPAHSFGNRSRTFDGLTKPEDIIDRIIIPHPGGTMKPEQGFWMGGQLPHWHYLAEARLS